MGQLTFDMILFLAGKGYEVSFRKNEAFPAPAQVLAIRVATEKYAYEHNVDISVHSIKGLTTDSLIAKVLQRMMLDMERVLEGGENHDQN